MAEFTTRPVIAGLPTLAEIEWASEPAKSTYEQSLNDLKLRRWEVIALVSIADYLDQLRDVLERLAELQAPKP